ncbi:hypothetical protein DASB73_009040 [Starmerella bacillaris]|uniref:Uncharacterized protein n=1 Tax=Starmerella bacillaris TaxID=1247836 RepID=A0AAV5RH92_STABA|nr:hypothetical protein DASB73_009040 [Starmerella bacillaris]
MARNITELADAVQSIARKNSKISLLNLRSVYEQSRAQFNKTKEELHSIENELSQLPEKIIAAQDVVDKLLELDLTVHESCLQTLSSICCAHKQNTYDLMTDGLTELASKQEIATKLAVEVLELNDCVKHYNQWGISAKNLGTVQNKREVLRLYNELYYDLEMESVLQSEESAHIRARLGPKVCPNTAEFENYRIQDTSLELELTTESDKFKFKKTYKPDKTAVPVSCVPVVPMPQKRVEHPVLWLSAQQSKKTKMSDSSGSIFDKFPNLQKYLD